MLALMLFLTACGAATEEIPTSPGQSELTTSGSEHVTSNESLHWLFPALEDNSYGVAVKNGFYEVIPRDTSDIGSSSGYNLCFTDLASHIRVPVCSNANCTHNNESCTSWLDKNVSVAFWNDQLILGNTDGSGFHWFDCMNPDGSGRKRLITVPDSMSVLEPIVASDQAFYGIGIMVDPKDPDAIPVSGLYRFDPINNSVSELLTLSGNNAASVLVGIGNGKLYLKRFLADGDDPFGIHELYAISTTGENLGSVIQWNGNKYTSGYFSDGQLFLLEQSTGNLEQIDLNTEERRVVGTLPTTDFMSVTLQGIWDGKMLVETWKHLDDAQATNVTRQYAIDLASGQTFELAVLGTNRLGEAVPYSLLAEGDSEFLVETGTRLINSHLATVSKKDFWNGSNNYSTITDAW